LNLAGGMDVCLMSVVCGQVEVSAMDRSLIQWSPTECGVYECDREALMMRRAWPTRGCCAMGREEETNKRTKKNMFHKCDLYSIN